VAFGSPRGVPALERFRAARTPEYAGRCAWPIVRPSRLSPVEPRIPCPQTDPSARQLLPRRSCWQGSCPPSELSSPVPNWLAFVGLRSLGTKWINLADAFQVARLPEYREVIADSQYGVSIGYEDLIPSRDRGDQKAFGQSGLAKGLVFDG